MKKSYYVYILASKKNGYLYTGVTNDLMSRTYLHKNDLVEGFTKKYGVHRLVHFEETDDISAAIAREKQIKGWRRQRKIALIQEENPE